MAVDCKSICETHKHRFKSYFFHFYFYRNFMLKNLNFFIDALIDFSIILWHKEDFFELFLIGVIAIVGVILVEESQKKSSNPEGNTKTAETPTAEVNVKPSDGNKSDSKVKK